MITQKLPLRPIHLETIVFIVLYFVVSNFVFIRSVAHPNLYFAYLIPLIFGVASTCIFLYLFSHQDFFNFIKDLEKAESKQEKKYLHRFQRFGKILACFIIAFVAGPLFLALTVRFLFKQTDNRYLIACIINFMVTIVMVSFAKGFIGLIF